MATDPRDKLDRERYKIRALVHFDDLTPELRDRLLEWSEALDPAIARHTYVDADGSEETQQPRTIEGYFSCLRIVAVDYGLDPLDTDAEEFNDLMVWLKDEKGRSGVTVAKYQSAAKTFFQYHDDLGVDPADLDVDSEQANVRYDEQDLYTEEDIWALRDACNDPRDRAFIELLIYTGQRITALLTLKVKDVDLEGGSIYLNEEYDAEHGGLKGALSRGRRRALLGATKYVRDLLQYHPHRTEYDNWPDADEWLFVGDPSLHRTAVGDHWDDGSAREALHRIARDAAVDKPPAAHNFRHYAATTLYRDWGWNEREIKAQLGLAKDSNIFETTYSHITDSELLDAGEEKFHGRGSPDEEEESLTPPTCPSCGEVLKPHWNECPNPSCTQVFGETGDEHIEKRLGEALSRLVREDPDLARQVIDAAELADAD